VDRALLLAFPELRSCVESVKYAFVGTVQRRRTCDDRYSQAALFPPCASQGSSFGAGSVWCHTMWTAPQLYGDLINGVVFSFLLAKVVSNWRVLEDGTKAAIDSIPWYHPVIVCSVCGMTLICIILALYHSRRPSCMADSDYRYHCTTTTIHNDSMYRMNSPRAWSYSAYAWLLVTPMASCYCNWPQVKEPPLLRQCAWHLIIATANVSHPTSVKMIQGGASLLVGLVILLLPRTVIISDVGSMVDGSIRYDD
jgi:hypothetical protein